MTDVPKANRSPVVSVPRWRFGAPVLTGSPGLIVEALVGRFAAGDEIGALADDYDITPQQVEEAVRAVCKAAWTRRGMRVAVYRELERAAVANAERLGLR